MHFSEKALAKKVQSLVPDVPVETILQVIIYENYKKNLPKNKQKILEKLEWKYHHENNYKKRRKR